MEMSSSIQCCSQGENGHGNTEEQPIWSVTRTAPLHSRQLQRSLGGKVNVSPASLTKSRFFLLPTYLAKLPQLENHDSYKLASQRSSQYSEFLTFPFPWKKSEPQSQPFTQGGLNCIKRTKQKRKHAALFPFPEQSTGLMTVLTAH